MRRAVLLLPILALVGACSRGGTDPEGPAAADLAGGADLGEGADLLSPDSETFVDDGAGCAVTPQAAAETLPDSDQGADDLPLTAEARLSLPAAQAAREQRRLLRSTADLEAVFGPGASGIDFAREWAFLYVAGAGAPRGSTPRVVRVRRRAASLRITTTLSAPVKACADAAPVTSYALVRFPRPALPSCRAAFYHRTDRAPCPSPAGPGVTCGGSLSDAGLAALLARPVVMARPRPLSTLRARELAAGTYAAWQRSCAGDGTCGIWLPVQVNNFHAFSLKLYMTEPDVRTGAPALFASSDEESCTLQSWGVCWDDTQVRPLVRTATVGTVEQPLDLWFRTVLDSDPDFPVAVGSTSAQFTAMDAVLADRCVLLEKWHRRSTGGTSYEEVLAQIHGEW